MPTSGLNWFWQHYNLRKLKFPRVIILPNGDVEIAIATGGESWNRKYIMIEGVLPKSSLSPIYVAILNRELFFDQEEIITI